MKRLTQRLGLPSPAMVVAVAALVVALGGTSYAALSVGSITTREIKDGTIRNVDFKDGTLRGQEFKRDSLGGGAIKEESLDATKLGKVRSATAADTAEQAAGLALHVTVGPDGERSNGRGVVSVAKLATGRYQVIFERDVRACTYLATLTILPPPEDRRTDPVTGEIATAPLANNVNGVEVATAASDGTPADRGFQLAVAC